MTLVKAKTTSEKARMEGIQPQLLFGTPQYLSPILWKAHVVDGSSRFAKHNIFKSDVFSIGLMFYQLSSMEDVTGYN